MARYATPDPMTLGEIAQCATMDQKSEACVSAFGEQIAFPHIEIMALRPNWAVRSHNQQYQSRYLNMRQRSQSSMPISAL